MATEESDDERKQLIDSLRSQINDLFTQVTQLNAKLIKSYDRVSDLEDDLHVTSSSLRTSTVKVSELELERTQHLNALNTGLLVERDHVTTELTKLMERATEEAAQRGQAETARQDIEKELDDLSASLFQQANTMVAEARFARSQSERKVVDAELALKIAEDAVAGMQKQMQNMQEEVQQQQKKATPFIIEGFTGSISRKFLSNHQPYHEFLLFLAHLRSLHVSPTIPIPTMSSLLQLPFLARLLVEDSDPTLRLDLAPSLSWLSRRSVLSAIHNGQLVIEPMSTSVLLHELSSTANGTHVHVHLACALCGTAISPSLGPSAGSTASWGRSLSLPKLSELRSLSGSYNNHNIPAPTDLPSQIHVFRVSAPSTSAVSQPQPPQHPTLNLPVINNSSSAAAGPYPLCPSGWCLRRLRLTCTLWAYVRTGVVDKIWEEDVPATVISPTEPVTAKGELTPHKKKRSLWNMASAFGERAAASFASGAEKYDGGAKTPSSSTPERRLPPLPAPTPIVPAPKPAEEEPSVTPARVSIEEPPRTSSERRAVPPLPRRSDGRTRPATPQHTSRKSVDLPIPPTQVPLPESRPATPSTPVRFAEAAPSPTTAAFPGTGLPPPVPRRAAKRISLIGASRPVTPKVDEQPKLEEQATETDEVPPSEPVVSKAEDKAEDTTATTQEPKTDTIPTSDSEAVVAPIEGKVEDVSTAITREPKTDTSALETVVAPTAQEHEETVVNGNTVDATAAHAAPAESDETREVTTPSEIEFTDVRTQLNDGESSSPSSETPADNDRDIVGDATWEDRTWKEIVQLREQLFWARVGVR